MSTTAPVIPELTPPAHGRGKVFAWALWDWGSAAFNTVVVTFVFSVYLTNGEDGGIASGLGNTADESNLMATEWLTRAMALAGFLIAILAPVAGQRADARGRRRLSVGMWTALVVLCSAGLFFVKADLSYLWIGLLLYAAGNVFFELSAVSYNAMLRQVSTPQTIGRVSGFGWSMGYFGGIILLLTCYLAFLTGDGDSRGFLGITTSEGLNVRYIALFAAVWFAIFAIPVLFAIPEVTPDPSVAQQGFFASYRQLFRDLKGLWSTSRNTVVFLIGSALFRDGMATIFALASVLAVQVYDFPSGSVLIFGVAANVVSALGALSAGRFDDILGPKKVIVASLFGILICGIALIFAHGPGAFWVLGLILCLFVGPVQSASRTFAARLAPPGRDGQMFGLYATTGRAVTFVAPTLVTVLTSAFASQRAGIAGILVTLLAGLIIMYWVRDPTRPAAVIGTASREK